MVTLSTGSLYPYGLNRIFEIAKKCDFDGLELLLRSNENAFYDSWDSKYLKFLIKKWRMPINSLHVPFEFENKPDNMEEIVKLALSIKARYIILHIPREDQFEYIDWFKKNKLECFGITFLIENIHFKTNKANPIYSTIEEFSVITNMVFDIAHALRSNQDPLYFLNKLKNIKQLHISNWDGSNDHTSILNNKKYFKKILSLVDADYCLELSPIAFKNFRNINEVTKILTQTCLLIKNQRNNFLISNKKTII